MQTNPCTRTEVHQPPTGNDSSYSYDVSLDLNLSISRGVPTFSGSFGRICRDSDVRSGCLSLLCPGNCHVTGVRTLTSFGPVLWRCYCCLPTSHSSGDKHVASDLHGAMQMSASSISWVSDSLHLIHTFHLIIMDWFTQRVVVKIEILVKGKTSLFHG